LRKIAPTRTRWQLTRAARLRALLLSHRYLTILMAAPPLAGRRGSVGHASSLLAVFRSSVDRQKQG
jgi:hypothetical protein